MLRKPREDWYMKRTILKHRYVKEMVNRYTKEIRIRALRMAAVGAERLNPMEYVHDLVERTKLRNVVTGTRYNHTHSGLRGKSK